MATLKDPGSAALRSVSSLADYTANLTHTISVTRRLHKRAQCESVAAAASSPIRVAAGTAKAAFEAGGAALLKRTAHEFD